MGCCPEYRRPPSEGSVSEAVQDCLSTYLYLRKRFPGKEILLGGESAGGALGASLLVELRDRGLPFPTRVMLMSPWADLNGDGEHAGLQGSEEMHHHERTDFLPRDLVNFAARTARGSGASKDWHVQPLRAPGSLASLPPIIVPYGLGEVLCGVCQNFCREWRSNGANITEVPVREGAHAPILFAFCHAPSSEALDRVVEFFDPGSYC